MLEQVKDFNYLGCDLSHNRDEDLQNKSFKFRRICGSMKRNLTNETRKDTQLKLYQVTAAPVLLHGCENWVLSRAGQRELKRLK
jgi:hypothetical protein